MKKLSVLIPNYNGEKLVPIFLPSVLKALDAYSGEKELIIVDDCSKDNSIEVLHSICNGKALIVKNEVNLGFSGTCNRAARESSGDVLFFLNTDVELPLDFFSFYKKYFEEKDNTFAVTVKGIQYRTKENLDGVKVPAWKRGNLRITGNTYPEIREDSWIPSFSVQGAYFFVDRTKFLALEGFDEKFNPYIFEETDLCYRASKRGWDIYYEPKCVGYHDHSSTLNSVSTKKKLRFISKRNRFIFTWKNINDPYLLWTHFLYTFLAMPTHFRAFRAAYAFLPEILEFRKNEKKHWVREDLEILNGFNSKYKKSLRDEFRGRA